ncbi:hypothetical protein ACJX0J_009180, partial [Zea mays]
MTAVIRFHQTPCLIHYDVQIADLVLLIIILLHKKKSCLFRQLFGYILMMETFFATEGMNEQSKRDGT